MSIVKDIVTSDFFILVVIPITIIVCVLYVCKIYNFSIIPKSLKNKRKKKKFRVPKISRTEINKSMGYAGKYMWSIDENTGEDIEPKKESKYEYTYAKENTEMSENKPSHYSAARVVPAYNNSSSKSRKNMYN
jgi:hypothetical protein